MKKVKSSFRNPVLFFIPLDKEEMDATYKQLHVCANCSRSPDNCTEQTIN